MTDPLSPLLSNREKFDFLDRIRDAYRLGLDFGETIKKIFKKIKGGGSLVINVAVLPSYLGKMSDNNIDNIVIIYYNCIYS